MKKFLALLISLSMLLVCVPGVSLVASAAYDIDAFIASENAAGRDGLSAETAYEISKGEQFEAFFTAANYPTYGVDKYFKQTADITIPSTYVPYQSSAKGAYDGQNFTITYNVGTSASSRATLTGSYFGVFGRSYMSITNVKTAGDWYITGSGTIYVGGIMARYNGGTFKNCENHINIDSNTSSTRIGGVVGQISNAGKITNVKNYGTIKNSSQYASGIACAVSENANLINCVNYGNVSGSSPVAGILASFSEKTVTIDGCANYGTITCGGKFGGIAGAATSATGTNLTIKNCLNAGYINNTSGTETAGSMLGLGIYDKKSTNITSAINITIQDCYNTGVVNNPSGSATSSCAGIIGAVSSTEADATKNAPTGTVTIKNYYDIANKNLEIYKSKIPGGTYHVIDLSGLTITVTDAYVLNPTKILADGTPVTGALLKTVPDGWSNWEAPTAGYPYIQLKTNKIDTTKVTSIVEDETVASVASGNNFVGDEALTGVKDAAGNVTDIAAGTKYAIVAARYAAMVGDYEYGILVEDKYFKAVRNSNGIFAVLVYDIDAGEYTYKPYVKVGEQYYYGAEGTFEIAE